MLNWLTRLLRPFFANPPDIYVCTGVEYTGANNVWRSHRYIVHYVGPFGAGTRDLYFSTFIPLDQVHERAVQIVRAMEAQHGTTL